MKFAQLFKVLDDDQKIAIDYRYERFTYKVWELIQDFAFYNEIAECTVSQVWYSQIYGAIVIELEVTE